MPTMKIGSKPQTPVVKIEGRKVEINIDEIKERLAKLELNIQPKSDIKANLLPEIIQTPNLIPTIIEKTEVVKEISKLDKRARKHSKLVSSKVLKLQEELDLKNKALVAKLEAVKAVVHELQLKKPEEKQIVTSQTIEVSRAPKLVYAGLALSLILNVLILIIK